MPETDEPLLFKSSSHYVEGGETRRGLRRGQTVSGWLFGMSGGGETEEEKEEERSLSLSLSAQFWENLDEDSQRCTRTELVSHVKDKKKEKERKTQLLCHQSTPIDKRVSSSLGGRKKMDIQPVCVAQILFPHIRDNRCQLSYPQETSAQPAGLT